MQESTYLIYKHTSPSGLAYIGQTKNYKKRINQHKEKINRCRLFGRAIKKYGWDNFTHEILENNLTIDEANFFEEVYILEHKTLTPHGYNLCTGGGNSIPCAETRAKIGAAHKGKTVSDYARARVAEANRNRVFTPEMRLKQSERAKNSTPETKAKISAANKGRIVTEEHKAKISKTKTGCIRKPYTDEHRKNMSMALIGNKRRLGIKHTTETKEKMTITRTNKEFRVRLRLAAATGIAKKANRPYSPVLFQ